MRTTRLVMSQPFRGRRRSRDRRSRRWPAGGRSSARQRRARRSRTSSPGGGRRGCRRSRPRAGRPPRIAEVVAVDGDVDAEGPETVGRAGDPVRFLVAELAGAADRRRAGRVRRGQAQDRDLVDRGRDVRPGRGRSRAARTSGRGGRRAARRRRPGRRARPRHRRGVSSMSAPIARSRSMIARRVGFTPTPRKDQVGVRVDRRRRRARRRPPTRRPGRARRSPSSSALLRD